MSPKARVFRLAGNIVAVCRKRQATPEWSDDLVSAAKSELIESSGTDLDLRDWVQSRF